MIGLPGSGREGEKSPACNLPLPDSIPSTIRNDDSAEEHLVLLYETAVRGTRNYESKELRWDSGGAFANESTSDAREKPVARTPTDEEIQLRA